MNDHQDVSAQSRRQSGKEKCKLIRQELQKGQFDAWCALPTKGRGVCQFTEYPPVNKWLTKKLELSTCEWDNVIKVTGNVLPVRTNLGFSQGNSRSKYWATSRGAA